MTTDHPGRCLGSTGHSRFLNSLQAFAFAVLVALFVSLLVPFSDGARSIVFGAFRVANIVLAILFTIWLVLQIKTAGSRRCRLSLVAGLTGFGALVAISVG